MITEIYVKARCDFGSGKYAVVIVEGGVVIHKVAFVIGKEFPYKDVMLKADQYNTEIVAVCYALQWCKANGKKIVNVYCNTNTCEKWYYRNEIPEERIIRESFSECAQNIDVYAEYIPKNSENEFNLLVNEMAQKAK